MKRYRKISGELSEVNTYSDKDGHELMRLLATVYFSSLPSSAEEKMQDINCFAIRYSDGSVSVDAACLIPWETSDEEMARTASSFASAISSIFEQKEVGDLIDVTWSAGFLDPRWDDLLTREERELFVV